MTPSRTSAGSSVRDAAFEVLRQRGLTTLFCNPGSTEIPLLTDLPDDLRFVAGLHEGAVVGMATGYAIARHQPALAVLHTTAGLGNAVGALATARVNRAPLVVVVGQQDRRHLAWEPFLAGRLGGLAGEYPVSVELPVRAQDVPGAISRAWHEAVSAQGPALVIVPMDDWTAEADARREAAPATLLRGEPEAEHAVQQLAAMIDEARAPTVVAGAGAATEAAWSALVALAERLACPVWQEPFGARPGFPQDHPFFAGHLPAEQGRLREALEPFDLVLVVGAPVFRQYAYEPGELAPKGARIALVGLHADELHRSTAELAVLASPAAVCSELAHRVAARSAQSALEPAHRPAPPARSAQLRAGHVLAALGERLPPDVVLLEEAPSSRAELHAYLPARSPLGFLSAAMGGLGFALPAAVGIRLAEHTRPVVVVLGDGAALFGLHALWSAAEYETGVLFVVLANGGYAIMDRLAEREGGSGPWPRIEVDVAAAARALGCPAERIASVDELERALDEVVPSLADRSEPLVLEVVVEPDPVTP